MGMMSGVVHRLARGEIGDDHCHGISPRCDFSMRLGKRYLQYLVKNQSSLLRPKIMHKSRPPFTPQAFFPKPTSYYQAQNLFKSSKYSK